MFTLKRDPSIDPFTGKKNMSVIQRKLVFIVIYTSSILHVLRSNDLCDSPQYMEIGSLGVVHCSFPGGFSSVHWYNTPDHISDYPALNYGPDSTKTGTGYTSGELDILPDGSLVIKNVSVKHEITFTVNKFNEDEELPEIYRIEVKTFVKPSLSCPVIDHCSCLQNMCFFAWSQVMQLVCRVTDARPRIDLSWRLRTVNGDESVPFQSSVDQGEVTETTSIVVSDLVNEPFRLITLVCKAEDSLNLLAKSESLILVYNRANIDLSEPNLISIEQHSQVVLTCSESNIDVIVWERLIGNESLQTVAVAHHFNNFSKIYDDGYLLNEEDGLTISDVGIHHEGIYSCTSISAETESTKSFKISVYVNPTPAHLVVDGCDHSVYCVLEASDLSGILTCSVKGIRPEIQLEWRVLRQEEANLINFRNQQTQSKNTGGTSDITLTTEYQIHKTTDKRLTLECTAKGPNSEYFDLSTKIDLLLPLYIAPNSTDETIPERNIPVQVIIPLVVGVAVVLVIVVILVLFCRDSSAKSGESKEEELKLIKKDPISVEFVSQLKQSYEVLYSSIQPVPYLQDTMYEVADVFVEGGVESLVNLPSKDERKWKPLRSYHEIFNDETSNCNRYIIEAEPGAGKSTLVLQMTYEWCVGKSDAILGAPEILILIKLIQLNSVSSIYEAIKKFILPRDSNIEVNDVKSIFNDAASIVIIFDGFDELPHTIKNAESDFSVILQKQMFPQFPVILTTRTDNLPKSLVPRTKRVRLTGFNTDAQEKYLRKVVTKEDTDAAEKVLEFLQENTVLGDLCQIPLFFVLYAHLSQTNKNIKECTSVTMFFRYVVSCFHSHLKKKSTDVDVTFVNKFETDIDELTVIAFESLCKDKRQSDWEQDQFESRLGKECLDYYLKVGILRQFQVTEISDLPGTSAAEHIQRRLKVKFYHDLFCEWYAANHVKRVFLAQNQHSNGKEKGNGDDYIEEEKFEFLEGLDLSNFHYVYRFACGLDPNVATQLIKYITASEGGDKFATLCLLERNGSADHIVEFVKYLCSRAIHIDRSYSKLIQRSIQQLITIAYAMEPKVEIGKLLLYESFLRVDNSKDEIVLTSGHRLSNENTINTLWIKCTDLESETLKELLIFCLKCAKLRSIAFSACALPFGFKDTTIMDQIVSKELDVKWYPSVVWYHLNPETGHWRSKNANGDVTKDEYDKEIARLKTMNIKEENSTDTK